MRLAMTESDKRRFWATVDRRGARECWPWQGTAHAASGGYGLFDRRRNGVRVARRAHRVAYELTNGPIPKGLMVRHSCDNPPCCNPRHLIPGTARDNSQDMVTRRRHWTQRWPARIPRGADHWTVRNGPGALPRGDAHPNAKLSTKRVRKIRDRYAAGGCTQRQLAKDFRVSQGAIWRVVRGDYWASC